MRSDNNGWLEYICAPWRADYQINSDSQPVDIGARTTPLPAPKPDTCALCIEPGNDHGNLILWRGAHNVLMLNRYPYIPGHLLVVPITHIPSLSALGHAGRCEAFELIDMAETILTNTYGPHGFNVGFNQGRAAGASIPDHLHIHVVPRWTGDTNFFSIIGGARSMPEKLEQTQERLLRALDDLLDQRRSA